MHWRCDWRSDECAGSPQRTDRGGGALTRLTALPDQSPHACEWGIWWASCILHFSCWCQWHSEASSLGLAREEGVLNTSKGIWGCGIGYGTVVSLYCADWRAGLLPAWLAYYFADWLIAWLAGWLSAQLADWLTAWLTGLVPGWLTAWLADWQADLLHGWLTAWLTAWLADWFTAWLPGLLPAWLTGLLPAGWLTAWLNNLLPGLTSMVGMRGVEQQYFDYLTDWLTGWLTVWFIDCI